TPRTRQTAGQGHRVQEGAGGFPRQALIQPTPPMKERILWLVLLLASLTGCRETEHSYSFEHRSDGIYRYDQITGEAAILRPNTAGWQTLTAAALSGQSLPLAITGTQSRYTFEW